MGREMAPGRRVRGKEMGTPEGSITSTGGGGGVASTVKSKVDHTVKLKVATTVITPTGAEAGRSYRLDRGIYRVIYRVLIPYHLHGPGEAGTVSEAFRKPFQEPFREAFREVLQREN